jgi:hypothetical protein
MSSSEKPKCKLCGERHWLREPHKLGNVEFTMDPAPVTPVTKSVTNPPSVTESSLLESVTHGGSRVGSGRKRRHNTNAQRQAAYRGKREVS